MPPAAASITVRSHQAPLLGTCYRVVGLLGRGGMGEVYRADLTPVALKCLRGDEPALADVMNPAEIGMRDLSGRAGLDCRRMPRFVGRQWE